MKTSWDEAHVPYTWENFSTKFKEHFIPSVDRDKKELEFLSLEQNVMTVAQYVAKFTALSRYCTHLVATEERKSTRFVRGLKTAIRTQLVAHKFQNFQDAVDRAYHVEHDIEEHKSRVEGTSVVNRGGKQDHNKAEIIGDFKVELHNFGDFREVNRMYQDKVLFRGM